MKLEIETRRKSQSIFKQRKREHERQDRVNKMREILQASER